MRNILQVTNLEGLFLIITCFCFLSSTNSALEKDLTLTWEQKLKLDKFKSNVSPIVPHDYMREDIYLIRWLRARNFKLVQAEEMLRSALEWRKREQMDTVLEENWSDFEARYPYIYDSFDKEGQPMAFLTLGHWDLRRAILAGEQGKLSRYLDAAIERMCTIVRNLQVEKKNVTQYDLFVDLSGFSLTQQGCLECLPVYIRFVSDYETYFPGMADKIVLVNTPAAFEIVLSAIQPFFSKQTRDSLQVFGTNRNVWQKVLYNYADKDQLPHELGGTKSEYPEH